MSNRYLKPSPLPFENHAALSLFAEERPSVDVVESAAAPRTRVHPDRVVPTARPRGFVAPTLFDVTGHDAGAEARRDDLDDADHDATTSTGATTPSTPVIVTAKTTKTTQTTRSVVRPSSNVTTTTARPVASTLNASAMSGELSGTLGPGFDIRRRAATRPGKLDVLGERVNLAIAQLRRRHQPGRHSGGRGLRIRVANWRSRPRPGRRSRGN